MKKAHVLVVARPSLPLGGLVLLLLAPPIDAAHTVPFTRVEELRSPDGLSVLRNENTDTSHFLSLKDVRSNTDRQILEYARWASALWAPDSHGFVVNDYGGSDFSKCLVFPRDGPERRIDLDDKLAKQLKSNQSIFSNHHVYVECVGWLSSTSLRVKVSGYGETDPDGFTLFYAYSIDGPFRFLKRINTYSPH
jgi:hypothetical protein